MINIYSSLSTINEQNISEILVTYSDSMNKIIELQNNMTSRNNKRAFNFMAAGFFVAVLSIFFFVIGKKKLSDFKISM